MILTGKSLITNYAKIYFYLLFIMMYTLSCSNDHTIKAEEVKDSFEGKITYSIEVIRSEKKDTTQSDKYFNHHGDTVELLFTKKGGFKEIFLNSADNGLVSRTFNKNNGELFVKRKNKEESKTTSVGADGFKVIRKQNLANEIILGVECNCYEYITKRYDEKGEVIIQYCYNSDTPYINAEFFKLYKERCLYDFFKTSNRPYMKLTLKTDRKITVYTAKSIEEMPISEDNFIVNKSDAASVEDYLRYKE